MPTLLDPASLSGERLRLLLAALRWLALTIVLAVGYFIAARLGFLVVAQPENVAVFWPAAGVAAGVMLAIGRSSQAPVATAIVAATLAASILHKAPLEVAVMFSIANAVESLIIARVLFACFGEPFSLDDMPRVIAFMAATAVGCAVSASIAATALVMFGSAKAEWGTIWSTWFESDAVGVVAVAPLAICLRTASARPFERLAALEGLVVLAVLIAAGTWIFLLPGRGAGMSMTSPAVVVFPLLLWLAARTPPVFSAAAVFAIAGVVVTTLTRGLGRFGDVASPLDERVFAAQLAILTASFCALALSALFEERRRAERLLQEREAQLKRALETGRIMAFAWVPSGKDLVRTQIAGYRLGGDQVGFGLDSTAYFAAIDPEDRARFAASLRSLSPAYPSYTITYRYRPAPDRTVWLEETGTIEFDTKGTTRRVTGLARDVTERVHADDRQRRLIAELNHRVKNVLSQITAVIDRSRERHTTVDDYVSVLRGRIGAMTRTHTRLSRSGWSGVGLAEIVADELAAYRSGQNVSIDGPPIILTPEAAQAMTLVVHELATNAAKYGALAPRGSGRVEVSWQMKGPGSNPDTLECVWQEHVSTPVPKPVHDGFGTSMIRNLLPHELGARVELTFQPDGARCVMTLPVGRAIDFTH